MDFEIVSKYLEFYVSWLFIDIYWKNEHRLTCTSEICTTAERDHFEKSVSFSFLFSNLIFKVDTVYLLNSMFLYFEKLDNWFGSTFHVFVFFFPWANYFNFIKHLKIWISNEKFVIYVTNSDQRCITRYFNKTQCRHTHNRGG